MKKRNLLLFIIVCFLLLVSFASAGPVEGLQQLANGLIDGLVIIFQFMFNLTDELESFGEFFVAKTILLIIIFIVTYSVLKKSSMFGKGKTAKNTNVIIALAIAILAIRFIPDSDFVNGILLPYGAFGTAVTMFLPFAIYFLFVMQNIKGTILRRSAWMFFGFIFAGLWWIRRNEISESVMWLYVALFACIILSIIFDKKIQSIRGLREINRFLTGANNRRIVTLQSRYLQIENNNSPQAVAEKKRIEEELEELGAYVIS